MDFTPMRRPKMFGRGWLLKQSLKTVKKHLPDMTNPEHRSTCISHIWFLLESRGDENQNQINFRMHMGWNFHIQPSSYLLELKLTSKLQFCLVWNWTVTSYSDIHMLKSRGDKQCVCVYAYMGMCVCVYVSVCVYMRDDLNRHAWGLLFNSRGDGHSDQALWCLWCLLESRGDK